MEDTFNTLKICQPLTWSLVIIVGMTTLSVILWQRSQGDTADKILTHFLLLIISILLTIFLVLIPMYNHGHEVGERVRQGKAIPLTLSNAINRVLTPMAVTYVRGVLFFHEADGKIYSVSDLQYADDLSGPAIEEVRFVNSYILFDRGGQLWIGRHTNIVASATIRH